jgi:hypothetical protein
MTLPTVTSVGECIDNLETFYTLLTKALSIKAPSIRIEVTAVRDKCLHNTPIMKKTNTR